MVCKPSAGRKLLVKLPRPAGPSLRGSIGRYCSAAFDSPQKRTVTPSPSCLRPSNVTHVEVDPDPVGKGERDVLRHDAKAARRLGVAR